MMGSEFNPFLSQRRTVVWESGRRKSYMNICEHRMLTVSFIGQVRKCPPGSWGCCMGGSPSHRGELRTKTNSYAPFTSSFTGLLSSTTCLAVGLCICLHQLLDGASQMMTGPGTNQVTGVGQLGLLICYC